VAAPKKVTNDAPQQHTPKRHVQRPPVSDEEHFIAPHTVATPPKATRTPSAPQPEVGRTAPLPRTPTPAPAEKPEYSKPNIIKPAPTESQDPAPAAPPIDQ
jgi:hypothetical protein